LRNNPNDEFDDEGKTKNTDYQVSAIHIRKLNKGFLKNGLTGSLPCCLASNAQISFSPTPYQLKI
jgi:hypothetical protein